MPVKGQPLSAETRQKMSQTFKQRYAEDPAYRRRKSEGQRKRRAREIEERASITVDRKACTKCKEIKPIAEFSHRKTKLKSGFISIRPESECRACVRGRCKARYQRIKEEGKLKELQERQKDWRERNIMRAREIERANSTTRRRKEGVAPRNFKKSRGADPREGERLPSSPLALFLEEQVAQYGKAEVARRASNGWSLDAAYRRMYDLLDAGTAFVSLSTVDHFLSGLGAPEKLNELYPLQEPKLGYHYLPA